MNGDLFLSAELLAAIKASGRTKREIAASIASIGGYKPGSVESMLIAGRRLPYVGSAKAIVAAVCREIEFPIERSLSPTPAEAPKPPASVVEPKPEPPVVLATPQPQPESPTLAVVTLSFAAPKAATSPAPRRRREGEFDRAAKDAQAAVDRKRGVRGGAVSVERRFREARAAVRAQRWRLSPEDCHARRGSSLHAKDDEAAVQHRAVSNI